MPDSIIQGFVAILSSVAILTPTDIATPGIFTDTVSVARRSSAKGTFCFTPNGGSIVGYVVVKIYQSVIDLKIGDASDKVATLYLFGEKINKIGQL